MTDEKRDDAAGRSGSALERGVSRRAQKLHAEGQHEHALCGFAYDAHESGDADEPVVFASIGQRVTCEQCRGHIDFVRRAYRGYTYAG